jgi:hypothetical protein
MQEFDTQMHVLTLFASSSVAGCMIGLPLEFVHDGIDGGGAGRQVRP